MVAMTTLRPPASTELPQSAHPVSLTWAREHGFVLPAGLTGRRRLTQRWPFLTPAAVLAHQLRRHLDWRLSGTGWARDRSESPLPVLVKKHASLLMRELSPEEMVLQRNKVVNLRLASARVHRILIGPGETFSFNKVVGNCTPRKGYVEGMKLDDGSAIAGVGGGICQLANLIHWMVLHSPLTVVERSEHTFDPFPDKGRVLPWGVGCSIAYNYVDLVFTNTTPATFELRVNVGDRHLHGELRADRAMTHSYSVRAEEERFWRVGSEFYRSNQIWRRTIDRRTGATTSDDVIKHNCALVKYEPVNKTIHEIQPEREGIEHPAG